MRTGGLASMLVAAAALFAPPAAAQDVLPGRVALSPAQVDHAAGRRVNRVKACYKDALDGSPQLFGVVAIGFKIAPDGKLLDHWIAMSTVGDPALEGCALKAFDGLEFPAPGGYGAEARFGMLLSVDVKKKTDRNTEMPDRAKVQEEAWRQAIGLAPATDTAGP